jgi:hypothetical protein
MQKWKKKLVVSQIALACTMAIASQANAKDISGTTYNTFGYDGTAASTLYNGYTDWNNASAAVDGDIYPVINKSVVNGVISGYYLDVCAKNCQYGREEGRALLASSARSGTQPARACIQPKRAGCGLSRVSVPHPAG